MCYMWNDHTCKNLESNLSFKKYYAFKSQSFTTHPLLRLTNSYFSIFYILLTNFQIYIYFKYIFIYIDFN